MRELKKIMTCFFIRDKNVLKKKLVSLLKIGSVRISSVTLLRNVP